MIEKSGGRIGSSRWWLPVAAFLAGMAVHAVMAAPRTETLAERPGSIVTTPVVSGSDAPPAPVMANADRDTSDIQLD
ncbi:MAG TPA: hypothetical protein VH854_02945 [Thermoanaerobaculia bacterium]|jgi:hypothetical protein|nr:hypothetical protein [Thermoanaerobaculia bacterium]